MLGRIIIITIMITITIITAPNKSTGTLTFSVYSSVCVGGGGGVEDTYDSDSQLTCTPQLIKTLYHFCLYLQLTDLAWITRQGTLQSPRWWSLLRGIAHSLLFLLHSVTKKKKKTASKSCSRSDTMLCLDTTTVFLIISGQGTHFYRLVNWSALVLDAFRCGFIQVFPPPFHSNVTYHTC